MKEGETRLINGSGDVESVGKIRDILFGQQMADYETRFAEVEKRLDARTDALEEEVKVLKSAMAARVDELADLVSGQKAARDQEEKIREELSSRLETLAAELRKGFS